MKQRTDAALDLSSLKDSREDIRHSREHLPSTGSLPVSVTLVLYEEASED